MNRLDENKFQEFPIAICLGDEGHVSEKNIVINADISGLGIPTSETVRVWGPGEPHPTIQHIDMSRNMIAAIAKPIVYITTLKVLKLAHNRLIKFPPMFDKLINITDLDFSHNLFSVQSHYMSPMPQM